MSKQAIFTIVSCNYFHHAKTLMRSVRNVDSVSDLFVILVDGGYDRKHYTSDVFQVINIADILIPEIKKMCFQYDILELNTAVKPFIIRHLLTKGYQKIVYLDPDIYVYNSLERIFLSLEEFEAVITPHLTDPLDDDFRPADIDILKAGAYNLGFIAVKSSTEIRKFIDWWAEKLVDDCRVALAEGIFCDQKWCDLLPSFVNQVLVDRHPGMNVAYWNLKHRQVAQCGDSYLVDGLPLIFFHFSGLGFNGLSLLSRHEDRFESIGLPRVIERLKRDYLRELSNNGAEFYSRQRYYFDYFEKSSIKISKPIRDLYRLNSSISSKFGTNPFDISRDPGFLKTYNRKIFGPKNPLTALCESIYKSRSDLQAYFPYALRGDSVGLSEWFVRNAALEYGLDNIFTESIRKDLAKAPKPRRKLKELPRSACNKILIKAAQFARPQHTSANIQESKSTFSSLRSQILRFGIAKSVSVAKRILGMDRCHKIRAALNDSLLSSFSSMTTSAPKSWAKISEEDHGLNVIGYLGAESGMGESARSTIRAATAAGIPLSAINFTHGCSSRKQEPMPLDHYNTSRHSVNVAHVNADQTPTLLRTLGPHFFSARYNIGYWVWETTEFPSEFLRSFECYDEIWTASEFCRDVIMRKSPKPVMKIPHSINLNPNLNISRSSLGLPEGAFLFLTMADFLSVPERKNPLGAIDAFVKAFGPDPKDVGLVVKISNSWYHPEIRKNILEKTTNSRSIVVIDDYMDRSSVTALISVTDCYVSLHRSEGFGLPIAEAMSLGKPVVATGWSGNMEFMNSTNSFPVKHDLVEISLKDGPYKNAGCWAEPDCNHAAELMSYVVGNQQHAQAVGSLAKARMANEYSIDAIGGLIKDRLTWIRESMN